MQGFLVLETKKKKKLYLSFCFCVCLFIMLIAKMEDGAVIFITYDYG